MKKLLLLCVFVVSMFAANATSVTWTASEKGYENQQKLDESSPIAIDEVISLSFSKGEGKTNPAYYNTGTNVRFYANNTMTFTAADGYLISSVSFNCSGNTYTFANATVTSGEITTEGTVSTWTGSSANFTITNAGTGQIRFTDFTITYDESSVLDINQVLGQWNVKNLTVRNSYNEETGAYGWQSAEDYNGYNTAIYKTSDNAFIIYNLFAWGYTIEGTINTTTNQIEIPAQMLYSFDYEDTEYQYWICKKPEDGYYSDNSSYWLLNGDADHWYNYKNSGLPITGTINEDGQLILDDICLYHYVAADWELYVATEFSGIVLDNPGDLLKAPISKPIVGYINEEGKIELSTNESDATIYYTTDGSVPTPNNGIEYSKAIDVVGEIGDIFTISAIVATEDNSSNVWTGEWEVVELLNKLNDAKSETYYWIEMPLTAIYASGSNVFVTDGSNYSLLYKYGLGIQTNDIIDGGWAAKAVVYNGYIEFIPEPATLTSSSVADPAPQPVEVTAAEADNILKANNVLGYFKLVDVAFDNGVASSGKTKGVMLGDKNYDVTMYNNLGAGAQNPGIYDVTGFLTLYDGNVQINPIAFDLKANCGIYAAADNTYADAVAFESEDGLYTYTTTEEITEIYLSRYDVADYFELGMIAPTVELENDMWTGYASSTEATVMPWKGIYTITVNVASEVLKVYTTSEKPEDPDDPDDPSGIDAIDADNANATYYNLQGLKVENPTTGSIVIRVLNGKAQKVMVK